MRRSFPGLVPWLALAVSLVACTAEVPASNPFDPASDSPAPGELRGVVRLAGGAPAAGASVVRASGGGTQADAEGRFRLEAPATLDGGPGETLTVSAERAGVPYGPIVRDGLRVPLGGVLDVGTIELPLASGAVVGVVRAEGRPLGGALVTVEGSAAAAVALPDGRFELRGAPVGFRRVTARADGFRFEPVLVEIPAAGAATVELAGARFALEVSLAPAARAQPGATATLELSLALLAQDAVEVQVSEDARFAEAAAGDVEPRPFAPTLAATLAEGADGPRTLFVQAATAAGDRTGVEALSVTLDRVAPAAPIVTLPPSTGAAALAFGLAVDDAAPSSGLASIELAVDGAAPVARAPAAPLELAALPEGLRLLSFAARDAAGNLGPAASWPLVIDRTAPELVGAVTIEDGRPDSIPGAARGREVVLVATLRDAGRLALATLACEGCDAAFTITVGGAAAAAQIALAPGPDEEVRIPVRLLAPSGGGGQLELAIADPAGNVTGASVPYVLDDDPPRIRALRAPAFTNAAALLPELETDPDAVLARAVAVPGSRCLPGVLEATPFALAPLAPLPLGTPEGPYAICAQVRDAAGNDSEIVAAVVVVDRTAPTPIARLELEALVPLVGTVGLDGLLVEKGGAALEAGFTNEPIAAAWIGARDEAPLTVQQLAADEGAPLTFAGAPAQPLVAGVPLRALVVLPPGDGLKVVAARVVDAAGNELLLPVAGAAHITLDRSPPDAPWIQPDAALVDLPPRSATLATRTLRFTGLDDQAGEHLELYAARAADRLDAAAPLVDARFVWGDVTRLVEAPCGAAYGCLDVVVPQDRVTRFFLRSVDPAGNVSPESPTELEEDSSAPTPPGALELVPGEGTVLARWQPPPRDVAGYELWFGAQVPGQTSALRLAGVVAAEGPSPVTSFAPQQQLNGLPNGSALTVAVRAFDRYALEHPELDGRFCPEAESSPHCSDFSPLASAWPGHVTPERLGELAVPGGLRDVVLHDGWAWAIGPIDPLAPAVLYTFDLSRPRLPVVTSTLPLGGAAYRVARSGGLLCAALGPAGVALLSIGDPAAPTLLSTVTGGTLARDCDLARERLAIAWQGEESLASCDPLRGGGATLHDVTNPAAPTLVDRFDYADDALLGAVTSVRLHGDSLYAGARIANGAGCAYADGDLVRIPLGGGPPTYGDNGEGGEVDAIATDGRQVAALRSGRLALHPLGELPFRGFEPSIVRTAAAAPRTATFLNVSDAAFSGSHLYVIDPNAVPADRVFGGALVVVDATDASTVGRLDVPGARGLDVEGPGIVIASVFGLTVARAVSPGEARIAERVGTSDTTVGGFGPLLVSTGGSGTPIFSLDGGGLARLTGLDGRAGEDQVTGCAPFSAAMTHDQVVLGCHGGGLQLWRHEAGRLTLQGSLPGLASVPDRMIVDGDRAFVLEHDGVVGTRLGIYRLPRDGAPTPLGTLSLSPLAVPEPDLALAGDRLWVALHGEGLRLVDVSDPGAPALLPVVGGPATAGGVAVQGRVLWTNVNLPGSNVIAWDATDPAALVELGRSSPSVGPGERTGPIRVALGVGVAVVFDADAVLLDLTDPLLPTLVGGPIEQLRGQGVEVVLSDTSFTLASSEGLSRIELD